MLQPWRVRTLMSAAKEKQALALKAQPTELRRCLRCEWWMRSTGPDHRICNSCKHAPVVGRLAPGSRVKSC